MQNDKKIHEKYRNIKENSETKKTNITKRAETYKDRNIRRYNIIKGTEDRCVQKYKNDTGR